MCRPYFAVVLALGLCCAGIGSATPVNGDFSSGLTAWTAQGDVAVESEAAVLGDDAEWYSLMYQGVALAPGAYELEFDFLNLLSAEVPNFALGPDYFVAGLYFTNDLASFDLMTGAYDAAMMLMDMDYSGVLNSNGAVSPVAGVTDWSRYSIVFDTTYAYVVPVFEFYDFNFVDNDSAISLDNVAIRPVEAVIPEPATVLILACGLALQANRKWRAR